MPSYRLLTSPMTGQLAELFGECRRSIFLTAPYVNEFGVTALMSAVRAAPAEISLKVLTSIQVQSLQKGSLDIASLITLCEHFPRATVASLPRLHAKVYVVDDAKAVISSANLTRGGLVDNYEYGILIRDRRVVLGIVEDMDGYSGLGSQFTLESLRDIAPDVSRLRALDAQADRRQKASQSGRALSLTASALQGKLLANRVRTRTINSIFAETIRYVLGLAPMTTEQLHSRIKDIHPDICDDTMDRVIRGQRFGKLWKHHVRNAQQFLKRRGEIELRQGGWQLIE